MALLCFEKRIYYWGTEFTTTASVGVKITGYFFSLELRMATFKSATLELSQHSTKNSFPYGVEFHKETKIRRVSLQLTDKLLKSHGGIGIWQDFYNCIVTQTVNHNVRFYCQSENNPIVGASLFNPKNSRDLRYRFFTLFDHKSNLLKSDTYKLKHSERTRSVTFSSAQERSPCHAGTCQEDSVGAEKALSISTTDQGLLELLDGLGTF